MLSIEASYFIFAFVAIMGTLQAIAAHQRLVGLSLIGDRMISPLAALPKAAKASDGERAYQRRPLPGLRPEDFAELSLGAQPEGYLLGLGLVGGAFLWFFATKEEIFIPGPAGAQFTLLFGAALICALGSTLLFSAAIHRPIEHQQPCSCQEVSFQGGQGVLYIPEGEGPYPAVCVLPSPGLGSDPLQGIATSLAREGIVVLVADLNLHRYPEILSLLPAAISYLASRVEVDPRRIGVIGVDLGADLALRAATDERVKALAALAPLVEEASARPGLRLLREMTYLQAMHWSRLLDGGRILARLETASYAEKIGPRPLLLLYGEEDGLVSLEKAHQTLGRAGEFKLVKGERHMTLPHSPVVASLLTQWFKERL